ncbi:MAG: efflux RND transporter periplasmic adaptor subunit [Planctomycetes bacterium]|nr:efflux RND transporter periplasmic adaptor subunit [Planctomycetota bacterium]
MRSTAKRIRTILVALVGTAAIVLVLLWLMGAFHEKIAAGPSREVLVPAQGAPTLVVRGVEAPVIETAIGSIEATRRIRVGSRILARVKAVHVNASQRVKAGDVLVELDDRDLTAAVSEAEAALASAKAAKSQAEIDLERSKGLLEKDIASKGRVERDETALQRAEAEVKRQEELLSQANTRLGFATIRSPSDGIVVDKHIEPGNTASPGQDLVTLYDPAHLQLVASVREALATKLSPGDKVTVHLDALDLTCQADVARIVPEASRASRSFRVEVTGPCPVGVYSGMFGRLELRTGTRREIHVPRTALRRAGQVDLCFVVRDDKTVIRRFVRVGREMAREDGAGDRVEILSGLEDGETILVNAADAVPAQDAAVEAAREGAAK